MLAKIDFDLGKLNCNSDKIGVTYEKHVSDNGLTKIDGIADTKNELWEQYRNYGDHVLLERNTEKSIGIWSVSTHNFHIDLDDMSTHVLIDSYPELDEASPYFVTDSITNIEKYYCNEIQDPNREFVISYIPVKKEHEPSDGGWRYCKWGEFIGDVQPDSEYLYDSTVHDVVYCVHIYEVKAK